MYHAELLLGSSMWENIHFELNVETKPLVCKIMDELQYVFFQLDKFKYLQRQFPEEISKLILEYELGDINSPCESLTKAGKACRNRTATLAVKLQMCPAHKKKMYKWIKRTLFIYNSLV